MNQLFEVQTKKFKRYYVLALSFDDAKSKVENEIIENDTNNILTLDGSLNTDYEIDIVETIKNLGKPIV